MGDKNPKDIKKRDKDKKGKKVKGGPNNGVVPLP